ncbi:phosphotransferase [Nonomuraea sp. NPDC047529]|uniref:phosphotransferase n=1 Tax=Nonomuraea sp. NPDC047529 TaxID=3155623 RepID=UPI0033CD5879
MEIGELLGTGRTADVYALGDGRVLRRNRFPVDSRREAEVMAHVAARGYPVPRVYPGGHGPADLVMERTPRGPMVIDWANAEEGPPALDRAMSAVILAEVAVRPETGIADVAHAALGGLLAGLGDALPGEEHLAAARARREANPTLSAAEIAGLGAAVGEITRLAAALG